MDRQTIRRSRLLAFAAAALLAALPAGPRAAPSLAPSLAPGAAAIPLPRIFRAAGDLRALLDRIDSGGEAGAAAEVERELPAAGAAVARLREAGTPERLREGSDRGIEALAQDARGQDRRLAGWQGALERRSEELQGTAAELRARQAAWGLTAQEARADRAPEVVLRTVAGALDALAAGDAHLRARQVRLLELAGQVSDLRGQLAELLAGAAAAQVELRRQLFEVEGAPLWRAFSSGSPAGASGALGAQLAQAVRETGEELARLFEAMGDRAWLPGAVLLAVAALLIALRRRLGEAALAEPELRGMAQLLRRPWSAAAILALLAVDGLAGGASPSVRELGFLLLLAPALRIGPALLPELEARVLAGLAVLLAVDRAAAVAPPHSLLARLAVLAVSAAALAGLVAGLRRRGWTRRLPGAALGPAARLADPVAAVLLAVALVANVAGEVALATRLTRATLVAAGLGAGLLAAFAVARGGLALLLRAPLLARRELVRRHRLLLERRAGTALRAAAVLSWGAATAGAFGITGALAAAAGRVVGLRLKVGGLDVSLGDLAAFGVTLALAVWLARAVRFLLDEGVFPEVALPRGVPAAVSATVQYALVAMGFAWAVLASGMEMTRFSFLAGTLGVGIGFGLQNVVNNFVSGLILLYERPVQVGDVVEIGGVSGVVRRIGVRSSTVRTFPGAEVILPNATLISSEVTNWTLSDRLRRVDLAVGVAYGTAPRRVLDLLLAAVRGRAGVVATPAPEAFLVRFGESSLDFSLRFWTDDVDRWPTLASEVLVELSEALEAAGIEIPFPQRDLRLRTVDGEALRAIAAAAGAAGSRPGDPVR